MASTTDRGRRPSGVQRKRPTTPAGSLRVKIPTSLLTCADEKDLFTASKTRDEELTFLWKRLRAGEVDEVVRKEFSRGFEIRVLIAHKWYSVFFYHNNPTGGYRV